VASGQRIRTRRRDLKLTQLEVANYIGVSKATVSLWENDVNTPNGPNLQGLARILKCSIPWLLGGGDEITPDANAEIADAQWLGDIEPWDSSTPLLPDEVELPFFTEVELAAGHGSCQITELHGPKLRFSRSTLKRKGVDPAGAACVLVKGNSMEPVIPEGATVGIDTAQTAIDDGKMYAIDHDGMLRIKVLYRQPGGGIRLRSFNEDEYPQEILNGEQAQRVRIIGKVFWYSVLL
jgi:phage repressor protein C with HTH and peptisase S24 domain